jgi:hypothetical protein
MQRDIQVFMDFLDTEKRAQRLASVQLKGGIDRAVFRVIVFCGNVFDTWFSPKAISRIARELAAPEKIME